MSWSDDIRCLYCDARLPLYRKIARGQFCSGKHGRAYWQEQERLGVERLHQTHTHLAAFHPKDPIEAILGPPPPAPKPRPDHSDLIPEMAGAVRASVSLFENAVAAVLAADPAEYESSLDPVPPHSGWARAEPEPAWGPMLGSRFALPGAGVRPTDLGTGSAGRASSVEVPEYRTSSPWIPQFPARLGVRIPTTSLIAGRRFEVKTLPPAAAAIEPAEPGLRPETRIALRIAPRNEELEAVLDRFAGQPAPLLSIRIAARKSAAEAISRELRRAVQEHPVLLPRHVAPHGPDWEPERVSLHRLPRPSQPALAAKGLALETSPIDLQVKTRTPLAELRTGTEPPLAGGTRYAVAARTMCRIPHAEPGNPEVVTPRAVTRVAGWNPADKGTAKTLPQSNELQKLSFRIAPAACEMQPRRSFGDAQPLDRDPALPVSHLEPSSFDPGLEYRVPGPWYAAIRNRIPGDPLRQMGSFWTRAPRDLKLLTFAIPALLALAFHPSLPKVRITAPRTAQQLPARVGSSVQTRFSSFRQAMVRRAAIALDDDFRAGLDDWTSRGNATAEWAFDSSGFVSPGPLALYKPSAALSDYQMQFLGLIGKRALSWVVRAADFDNYYVVKLVMTKTGPVPAIGVTRYAVINGKAQDRADTQLHFEARQDMPRQDMLYRVQLNLDGPNFTLYVQGQLADHWTDERLLKGGIGFFNARGEDGRVRWVQIKHQYDMLGRLCAFLAPYQYAANIASSNPSINGSIQQ